MKVACVALLVVAVVALFTQAGAHKDETDFACYECKKSYSNEQCNAQGIKYCKSKEQACVTIEEEKKDGIEIEKKCIDPASKYCREQPYCKGSDDSKCYYCCYEPLCNVENPQPKDPCECKPCLNGGTCHPSDDGTSFTCACPADYTGSYCENLVDRDDPCDSNPCFNDGTCRSMGDEVDCDCHPAYTGQYCEIAVDPCSPDNPCMNGATCWASGDSYRCECPNGFSGEHCEKEDHPCASNPCQNGGTCTAHCTGYTCLCLPGYTGKNCESPDNECLRCPHEFGLYADPFDCTMFYHCSHWVPYHKNCPHPLHFNDFLKVCDWPENAKCVPMTMTDAQEADWNLMKCKCLIEQTIPPEDDEGIGKREEEEDEDEGEWEPEDGPPEEKPEGVGEERLEEILDKLSDIIDDIEHDILHEDD